MLLTLAVLQAVGLAVLLSRLWPGRRRIPPVEPDERPRSTDAVTIIVPTLNEAHRIGPCLEGLIAQPRLVREILVVDSGSTDGTVELVEAAALRDSRIRLLRDEPLPDGWVGKVWALQHGYNHASGEWILGVDADTAPQPGMAGGTLSAAISRGLDVVSFAPRFRTSTTPERWLQPALLVTLVYRFGAPAVGRPNDRIMANGQCFLARKEALAAVGGYVPARGSFSDDVTLGRALAERGFRVGFLDGSRLYDVRAYASAGEVWREWGRSLDLKDSTTVARQWMDVLFLLIVQGSPLLALCILAVGGQSAPLLATSVALLVPRILLLRALAPSYEQRGMPFWLSPLADPLAALRILLSTMRRPRMWRGRRYPGIPVSARNSSFEAG